MGDQDNLDALAAHARRELEARDLRWEALALGDIDEASLRDELGEDEARERSIELFRPLADDERDAITQALLARARDPREGEAKVVPLVRQAPRWRRLLTAAAPLAAAAALALWLIPGDPERPGREAPTVHDALPTYHLEVRGGVEEQRSSAPTAARQSNRYSPDTAFELVLRPAHDVDHEVRARVFAFAEDGTGQALTVPIEVAPSGSLLVKGRAREALPLAPGTWRLVFAVGHPDALPERAEEVRALPAHAAAPSRRFWVEEYTVELLPE